VSIRLYVRRCITESRIQERKKDDDERRHAILAFATGHVWRSRQLRVRCCLLPGQQIVIKGTVTCSEIQASNLRVAGGRSRFEFAVPLTSAWLSLSAERRQ